MNYKIFKYDPYLLPYKKDIKLRMDNYFKKKKELLSEGETLLDFANAHEYFGIHKTQDGWVYREWAPGADNVFIMGDMNGWNQTELRLSPIGNGVLRYIFPNTDSFITVVR